MGVRLPGRAGPGKLAKMSALAPPIAPVDLLGVPVHPLTLAEAVAHLAEAIARRRPTTVVSLNGALLMRVLRDPQVRDAVRGATLVIPDGIGVLLAARILGVPVRRRVAGVDLAETLCAAVAPRRGRVFLLGAAPGVADAAAAQLQQRCPGLEVAGTAHGFFPPEDEPALLARIRRAAPDILLVAFGAPRQEDWMRRYGASLSVPVTMGVGGTLDVLAGRTGRAPRWVQAAGLEWLYRMVRQPWRWSVVKTIPPLFLIALRERFRGGRGGQARRGETPGIEPGGRRNENRSEHPADDISEKEVRAATE